MVTVKQKLSKEVLEFLEKDKTLNLVNELQQKVIDDFVTKYDKHILEQTRSRLESKGYTFKDGQDFIDFCCANIQRVNYDDKPNYFELYLGYKGSDDKGYLILFGNENINIQDISNGNITYTIG
tara:strand:+ start:491 stop:862 length:372 start_codon:yes stop_codon:yes gene_type:complete